MPFISPRQVLYRALKKRIRHMFAVCLQLDLDSQEFSEADDDMFDLIRMLHLLEGSFLLQSMQCIPRISNQAQTATRYLAPRIRNAKDIEHRELLWTMSPKDFKQVCRMTKESFDMLLNIIKDDPVFHNKVPFFFFKPFIHIFRYRI